MLQIKLINKISRKPAAVSLMSCVSNAFMCSFRGGPQLMGGRKFLKKLKNLIITWHYINIVVTSLSPIKSIVCWLTVSTFKCAFMSELFFVPTLLILFFKLWFNSQTISLKINNFNLMLQAILDIHHSVRAFQRFKKFVNLRAQTERVMTLKWFQIKIE